jgi:hypothetical protein
MFRQMAGETEEEGNLPGSGLIVEESARLH